MSLGPEARRGESPAPGANIGPVPGAPSVENAPAPSPESTPAYSEGFQPFQPSVGPAAATPTYSAGFSPVTPDMLRAPIINPAPPSFLDRLNSGQRIYSTMDGIWKSAKEGFGDQPLGTTDNKDLAGAMGVSIPIKRAVEAYDLLTRTINAGVHGTAEFAAQAARDFGYSQGMSERAREDVLNFGTWLMSEGGMRATIGDAAKHAPLVDAGDGKLARIVPGPDGKATPQIVGEFPPKPADFDTATQEIVNGSPPKHGIVVAFEHQGKIYYGKDGETHLDLLERNGLEGLEDQVKDGFAGPNGKFLTREETGDGAHFPKDELSNNIKQDLNDANALMKEHGVQDSTGFGYNITWNKREDSLYLSRQEDGGERLLLEDVLQKSQAEIRQAIQKGVRHAGFDASLMDHYYSSNAASIQGARESMPRPDFAPKPDAARVKQKLLDAWENEGKHPAEVAADAESDAMVRHDLSSAATHPTDMPSPVSPDIQPVSIPGKILSDLGTLKDRAFDAARWVEKNLTPISTSPDYAIRYATEYLSSLRRVQWDWTRYDQMLMEKFNPEQRAAMWRAMDEESVMAQSGERSEHIGLATLAPEERAAVSELSQHAIATRIQMLDKGMVTTEGLPHYVPRLFKGKGTPEPISMGPEARIRERTGSMNERKYLTAEESEAAAKERFGPQTELVRDIRTLPLVLAKQQRAIAAHDFIEAVRKFGRDIGDPQIVEGEKPGAGKWITLPDSDLADWYFRSNGETTFATKQPMHIKGEWEGAIKAIQDTKFNNFDKFIAEVKNRPMSLIMNSPFIHASVVYSKALPSNPGNMITFRFMRQGNQLLNDPAFMKDMIDGGMVLWGRRPTLYQDVTGMMEAPHLEPGRSLTSRVLAYLPGLFDEAAGAAVKRGVDKVGEIVHDKILAESVQKLQASLAYDFRETMRKKFPDVPDDALNVLAAHEANRFGGSLPPEAMSSFSRGFANATMFSRQFTLGNLGILKDAAKGPPEYVMGRVRDMLGPEGADQAAALKSQMKRHAFAVVMLDLAMYYGMNALFQSTVNVASGTPLADEAAGYWWRINQAVNRVQEHPTSVSSYLSFLPSMSPTFYHEPGKEGKILLGLRSDGTAIYARSVIGRMGEDYTGLLINPAMYALTKAAPLPRAFMEVLGNKDGFDRPIYDPKALKAGDIGQAWNIAKHFIDAELPMQQIKGATNLIEGQGDYKDAISTFGPYMVPPFTVTASQGYPGGPIAGAVAGHQRDQRVAQDLAMSGVKDMVVKKNDIPGARQAMSDLGVKPGLQNFLIRNWQNPGMAKTSSRALAEFYQHASPVEIEILNAMRNGGP